MSGIPLNLSVVGNKIMLQKCSLYAHYHAMLESHHIVPESWWKAAGKPVLSPLRDLCPNCHYSVHVAIDGTIKGQDISNIPVRCRDLALVGIAQAKQNGLTPALTL